MTLTEDAERIYTDSDHVSVEEFLDVLSRIGNELRTADTKEYLEKKIIAVRSAEPKERQKLCKKLLPYLAWYMSRSNN
ncbi:MAG: hypothetical protein F4Y82_01700 [Cenarchaeum sp. SB0665_bin_23]|nr:hypothetical protein [Cenarchaeum sp. SB0667_bin_13]MXY60817.1 hypothetical protein [Cenarchaeum sp. SB0665_bin_23]MYB46624.1 hypothetical protein [Cenarchaeum sp. SB0662_bin_33]MYC80185.1 hypothetical protein [Cenarchaeum sp. SB0661_bin_35]MYD59222.1 hypothetical protein [Cenarchaeum sp. SB0678_bin_8]MYG32463.1 hypothetical protein [Cenarchaeum sp. SB0677_bin_16]